MNLYRKTYALIDKNSIENNIAEIKKQVGKTCEIVAVVKADAYGHGAKEVSLIAESSGVSCLAVALAEEAITLRDAKINLPILVMCRSNDKQMELAVSLNLELSVCSAQDIYTLQKIAQKAKKEMCVHVKIDTGMGRIGIRTKEELQEMILALQSSKNIHLVGVFTHFACADEQNKDFTRLQHDKFMEFVKILKKTGYSPKIHMSNSAASIDLPEFSYDCIRYGISLYGCYPSDEVCANNVKLQPAMQVFAEISQIKQVAKGTPIGYGSTHLTTADATIATVQIGYGDGYNRLLSNRGRMIVKTKEGPKFANIVGRVCMDQTMIDITGFTGVEVGDTVTVLGEIEDKKITADEIATICNTINYEILLDFSDRVPRIYE